MPIDLTQLPTEQSLNNAIHEGKGSQLEIKGAIPSVDNLSHLISSFANATGGWLIVGVKENGGSIGINWQALTNVFERAAARLTPGPNAMTHQVNVNGRVVGVIVVKPSRTVVASPQGAFVRVGIEDRRMTPAQISSTPPKVPPGAADENAAEVINRLAGTVNILLAKVEYSQSWRGQGMGCCIGVLASCLAAGVVALLIVGYQWLMS